MLNFCVSDIQFYYTRASLLYLPVCIHVLIKVSLIGLQSETSIRYRFVIAARSNIKSLILQVFFPLFVELGLLQRCEYIYPHHELHLRRARWRLPIWD